MEAATITTIHSLMNDQPVLDAYHHTDLRKTRAASQSIIPVDTGLAVGIERILPALGRQALGTRLAGAHDEGVSDRIDGRNRRVL